MIVAFFVHMAVWNAHLYRRRGNVIFFDKKAYRIYRNEIPCLLKITASTNPNAMLWLLKTNWKNLLFINEKKYDSIAKPKKINTMLGIWINHIAIKIKLHDIHFQTIILLNATWRSSSFSSISNLRYSKSSSASESLSISALFLSLPRKNLSVWYSLILFLILLSIRWNYQNVLQPSYINGYGCQEDLVSLKYQR